MTKITLDVKFSPSPPIPVPVTPHQVNRAMTTGVMNLVRQHLIDYDNTHPNKLGGKRSHFYLTAADATTWDADDQGGNVYINKIGIRQRLLGGKIVAQNSQYLTIPAIAEAYNRMAREFSNLRFVRFGKGPNALAALVEAKEGATEAETGKKVRGRKAAYKKTGYPQRVFYWLKKEVYQKGDPGVIPTVDEMASVALEAANNYFALRFKT